MYVDQDSHSTGHPNTNTVIQNSYKMWSLMIKAIATAAVHASQSLTARARLPSATNPAISSYWLLVPLVPKHPATEGSMQCIFNDLAVALPAVAWTTAINLVISL